MTCKASKTCKASRFHRHPTVGHAPRSGPEVKNGRSCAKDAATGGGELNPVEGVRGTA